MQKVEVEQLEQPLGQITQIPEASVSPGGQSVKHSPKWNAFGDIQESQEVAEPEQVRQSP